MVNVNKLKGKIVERELTVEKLADKIGISRSTMYRKLHQGGATLTIKEVNSICDVLGLNHREATEIFFGPRVASDATNCGFELGGAPNGN